MNAVLELPDAEFFWLVGRARCRRAFVKLHGGSEVDGPGGRILFVKRQGLTIIQRQIGPDNLR